MEIALPKLDYATADVNTNLIEKANTVLNEIKHYDVVIAHINGTDEVSHRKDVMGKVKFIEKIDKEFISLVIENVKNTKVIVLSDHQTSSVTGNHQKGFVDIIKTIIKE
jgi:2,3-bisphosphoglycerate-independent phosphoglycerate mutase